MAQHPHFSALPSMVWAVDAAADVDFYEYTDWLDEVTGLWFMEFRFSVHSTVISGTLNHMLRVNLPPGRVARANGDVGLAVQQGATKIDGCYGRYLDTSSLLRVYRPGQVNWAAYNNLSVVLTAANIPIYNPNI